MTKAKRKTVKKAASPKKLKAKTRRKGVGPIGPARIIIHQSGEAGVYQINLQVLTKDNAPAHAEILVMDLDDLTFRRSIAATKNGTAQLDVSFTKPQMRLKFLVVGSPVTERRNLYGPPEED
ncbi:MAG: hypothetical protein AAB759_02825 [Patescibacteria group bacterium]